MKCCPDHHHEEYPTVHPVSLNESPLKQPTKDDFLEECRKKQKEEMWVWNIKVRSELRLWKLPEAMRDPKLLVNNEVPGRDEHSSSNWESQRK